MRIIGGFRKGKILMSPKDGLVRPTTDRIKENIFNILQFKIANSVVLDLFSGSGAMGLEAVSRGAERVIFCDNSADSVKLTKINAESIGIKPEILHCDFKDAINTLNKSGVKFDVVFVDPPYSKGMGEEAMNLLLKKGLLDLEGIIVYEFAADDEGANNFVCNLAFNADIRKYGNTKVAFIKI